MAIQKQDPQMAADAISRIASNQLGVPTQQAQTQQPAPPATQHQAPKQKDTAPEQAAAKGAPDTGSFFFFSCFTFLIFAESIYLIS